jgi:hypothetical protein
VDDRAELDLVGAERLLVDHGGAAQPLFELGDPALQQRLFVLGVVVLGVLGDVAELARFLDPRRNFTTFRRREVLDFLFELLEPFWGDDGLATHLSNLALVCGEPGIGSQTQKTRMRRISLATPGHEVARL